LNAPVPIYGDVTVPDPLQSDSMQWLAGELGAYRKRESTGAMAGRDTRKTTVRGRKTAIARSRNPTDIPGKNFTLGPSGGRSKAAPR